jgi:hypothetical protein
LAGAVAGFGGVVGAAVVGPDVAGLAPGVVGAAGFGGTRLGVSGVVSMRLGPVYGSGFLLELMYEANKRFSFSLDFRARSISAHVAFSGNLRPVAARFRASSIFVSNSDFGATGAAVGAWLGACGAPAVDCC